MKQIEIDRIQSEIDNLEKQVAEKKNRLAILKDQINAATQQQKALATVNLSNNLFANPSNKPSDAKEAINNHSPPETKIALFRSLFKGREDVYAKRYDNKKSGESGYQPVCKNEWIRGICGKSSPRDAGNAGPKKVKCAVCEARALDPVTDAVIKNHLSGFIYDDYRNVAIPFVMGVYPLLQNEYCHFLAVDFDKASWQDDAKAFLETCNAENIPASLERSRSGNGAHIWIFFETSVPATKARKLGSFLMTRTLDRRPEIGLESFDRFFPNQDTLPKGGFGNLIALPLQKTAREKNHSVFLDGNLIPFPDQWAYLNSIRRISADNLDSIIQIASARHEILPVAFDPAEIEEDESKPWQKQTNVLPPINEPLPAMVDVVCADQIYVDYTGLPAMLRNRILRLTSFSNPEFYRNQAMRLPTWNKPRILHCYDFYKKYIGLPVGCFDDLKDVFDFYKITALVNDEQNHGKSINVQFRGILRDEQKEAAHILTRHNTGILSASTAFGKTVVALSIIAQRNVNTLILVHRKQLMDQWIERIAQFLDIPKKEIGQFGGGKKKLTGIVDVAMLQSLAKTNQVENCVKDYGQIIVDECHHIAANIFEKVIRNCSAYYRLGLSATVMRKDGQHPIVIMNLGPIRFKSSRQKSNFSQRVITRHTDFEMPDKNDKTPTAIHDIFRFLCEDEKRNNFIAQDIISAGNEGRECLVLTERIEHLVFLQEILKEKIPYLFVLKGGMGKKQTKLIMEEIGNVPQNAHRVILATGKYLGEGFDLPCLDTLFLAFPFSWKGTLIQYAGRLNRTYYLKSEIRIYDYADTKIPMLERMYKKRLKGYASLGFSAE
jgi:superfamily II DNA or RNA helicase